MLVTRILWCSARSLDFVPGFFCCLLSVKEQPLGRSRAESALSAGAQNQPVMGAIRV